MYSVAYRYDGVGSVGLMHSVYDDSITPTQIDSAMNLLPIL